MTDMPLATPLAVLVPSMDERRWAAGTHLGVMILAFLTSWFAGLAGVAGAAGVILVKPLNSEFVVRHAKEAFNFNLSIAIYTVGGVLIGAMFSALTLGLGLLLVVPLAIVIALAMAILWLVCSVKAAMQAIDGEDYRYPLTIRFWR